MEGGNREALLDKDLSSHPVTSLALWTYSDGNASLTTYLAGCWLGLGHLDLALAVCAKQEGYTEHVCSLSLILS